MMAFLFVFVDHSLVETLVRISAFLISKSALHAIQKSTDFVAELF